MVKIGKHSWVGRFSVDVATILLDHELGFVADSDVRVLSGFVAIGGHTFASDEAWVPIET